MELPFGGTFASDDFFTGTRAAAFGGRRRSSRFSKIDLDFARKGHLNADIADENRIHQTESPIASVPYVSPPFEKI